MFVSSGTGISYRDYVGEQVFTRAGMDHADFCAMDGVHQKVAEHYTQADDRDGPGDWRKNIYSYPPIGSPDGGATVTALDLDRLMRAVLKGNLIDDPWRTAFLTPQVKSHESDDGSFWNGFAFEFKRDAAGTVTRMHKEGSNPGVSAMLAFDPSVDTTVVLLANTDYGIWTTVGTIELLQAEQRTR